MQHHVYLKTFHSYPGQNHDANRNPVTRRLIIILNVKLRQSLFPSFKIYMWTMRQKINNKLFYAHVLCYLSIEMENKLSIVTCRTIAIQLKPNILNKHWLNVANLLGCFVRQLPSRNGPPNAVLVLPHRRIIPH